MSFKFGGSPFGASSTANGAQAQTGPDLEEIFTEALGFHAVNGESKVRILPSAWPSDNLPPPTSSLLSITSSKGLLAAAGPESVVVAKTESIRNAFDAQAADGDYRAFTPELIIPIGTRISQLAFSSDGDLLVLSAELGGGLAIYETSSLLQGNTQSSFELPTNGSSIRALAANPNPAAETGSYFAVVTSKGELLLADMKSRQFVNGQNGQILKDGVSSVSWSNKGKQIVAGLGDGTAVQLKPEGTVVAEIPKPLAVEGDQHISAISWLKDDIFLVVHTPSSAGDMGAPPSTYHIITRQKGAPWLFSKLPEICAPFGLNRSPPVQFIQRLRDFPPHLKEAVVVSSTASQDIGLFTQSEQALVTDMPQDKVTNVFTATGMATDSRRAMLPMTEDMTSDTSTIGMALDLSSTSKVSRPIPGDELEWSQAPLPALLVLNNEGALCGWWIVYSDSVKQGLMYPGLVAAQGQQQQTPVQATASPFGAAGSTPAPHTQPAFGQSAFGASTTTPAFGSATKTSVSPFGNSNTFGTSPGAFGSAGSWANKASPWGAPTSSPAAANKTSTQPAFGSTSALGLGAKPAFGSAAGLGGKSSPWGTPAQATSSPTPSAFGQASNLGQKPNPFASAATPAPAFGSANTATSGSSSGFASFASSGGFAGAANTAAPKPESGSIFKQPSTASPWNPTPSAFGAAPGAFGASATNDDSMTSTPKKEEPNTSTGLFGAPKEGFKLNSSWTNPGDSKENDKASKPAFGATPAKPQSSFFGGDFGKALGNTSEDTPAPQSKESDMTSEPTSPKPQPQETTTPADTPASNKFFPAPPATGGMFGTQTLDKSTPAGVQQSQPAAISNEQPSLAVQSPEEKDTPKIKQEPTDDEQSSGLDKDIPQAPLPPDTTSKATYTPGTSSTSSTTASKNNTDETPVPSETQQLSSKPSSQFVLDDAPLPPDFAPTVAKAKEAAEESNSVPSQEQPQAEHALPEDSNDEGLDGEGSGVDVGKELDSPQEPSPKVTPESSFGQKTDKSPPGGLFSKINQPQSKPATKTLFGELGASPATFFPPPNRVESSPRSPSPVRRGLGGDHLRPDTARSVSAPGVPSRDTSRKVTMGRPVPDTAVYPPQPSIDRRQREEREQQARLRAQAEAEEQQDLSDDDRATAVQNELDSEIQPTLHLDEFIAHEDYNGETKPGVPGQVERVYRDITSMVDILGLNSRALQAWIQGNEGLIPENGRDLEALETPSEWCLDEIDNLESLQNSLSLDLEDGSVKNAADMLESCAHLQRDVLALRAKVEDIRRTRDVQNDKNNSEAARNAKLSAEQSAMRKDLFRDLNKVQKVLAQAEEAATLLRAKLASHESSDQKSSGASRAPTAEAVEKTIKKMTGMVEKKSGDIDFLEIQMRKLGVRGSTPGSREGSPFVTPPTSARKGRAMLTPNGSVNGNAFHTPRSSRSRFASSMGSDASDLSRSIGRSPRKKVTEITSDEASQYAAKAARKKHMQTLLKEALIGESKIRVRTLDE